MAYQAKLRVIEAEKERKEAANDLARAAEIAYEETEKAEEIEKYEWLRGAEEEAEET